MVAALAPDEPEAKGLLALMLFAHARRAARRDALGRYVSLSEQDAALWDAAAIDEAERLLQQASAAQSAGRFQLEAAVQSAHAARRLVGATDWEAIAALYDALYVLTGSPVVAINRAAAVAHTRDPAEGLALLEAAGGEGRLDAFEPYWVAKADLNARIGERDAARQAYTVAIGLETDPAARAFLIERLAAVG